MSLTAQLYLVQTGITINRGNRLEAGGEPRQPETPIEAGFMPKARKANIAICYDFDGTLIRGNMQENSFLPDIGVSA